MFNIAADEIHTLEEVAAEVGRQTGALDVSFDDSCDLPNYRIWKLSGDRAAAELGYRPEFPLAAGIRRYRAEAFSTATTNPM